MPKEKKEEVKVEPVPEKGITENDIKKRIKKYGEALRTLTDQGQKVKAERDKLSTQLIQITDQAKELVGGIKGLQDILNERKGNS